MAAISANEQPVVATRRQRAAGWMVHAYTATGSVLALLVIIAALDGNTVRAFWILLVAFIVDYLTYVFAPVMLLWVGGHLPDGTLGVVLAALPLLASSYQFCRVDAKTDDHCFLGFPSSWNVVAFYVVIL